MTDRLPSDSFAISLNGKTYTLKFGDLTSLDTMALRRATGMSLRALMQAATEDMDLDIVAAIVWLARRTHGERTLTFDAVAAEIGYDVDLDVVTPDASEDDSPEA